MKLEKADLYAIKHNESMTLEADGHDYHFSLSGSSAAITAAWKACESRINASERANRNSPLATTRVEKASSAPTKEASDYYTSPGLNDDALSEEANDHGDNVTLVMSLMLAGAVVFTPFLIIILMVMNFQREESKASAGEYEPGCFKDRQGPGQSEGKNRRGNARGSGHAGENSRQYQGSEQARWQHAEDEAHGSRKQESSRRKDDRRDQASEPNKFFSCPSCRARVVVRPPFAVERSGRCTHCGAQFSVRVDEFGALHVESIRANVSDAEDSELNSVDDCLRFLEVSSIATKAEVRKAYQRKMAQYHPDKVSRLGERLRAVAEQETKRLNRAKRILMDNGYL